MHEPLQGETSQVARLSVRSAVERAAIVVSNGFGVALSSAHAQNFFV